MIVTKFERTLSGRYTQIFANYFNLLSRSFKRRFQTMMFHGKQFFFIMSRRPNLNLNSFKFTILSLCKKFHIK